MAEKINESYSENVKNFSLLTAEEEKYLGNLAFNGDKNAQKKLVEANLRYVMKIAHKFEGHGMAYEDLVQEGNIGLLHAAQKFNPSKNVRFLTYANYWIVQEIDRALCTKGKAIRLPMNKMEEFKKDKWNTVSLDSKINKNEDKTLEDFLEDKKSNSPEENFFNYYIAEILNKLVKELSPLEEDVIKLRYGLCENAPASLEKIGNKYHYSKERVRQFEVKILKNLRKKLYDLGYEELAS